MEDKLKQLNKAVWKKASQVQPGMKIAIPDIESETGYSFDEIVSINPVGREEVWDIEVEGTHNFIGNDIFAHNTYANGGPAVPADVVAYDSAGNIGKASSGDEPAGIMTGFGANGSISYAFDGSRASVKVTTENGAIKTGDRLTVSKTIPGYAMKMTSAGQSIGVALSDFSDIASGSGEVTALADVNYWAPDIAAVDGSTASGSATVTVSSGDILTALANAVMTRVQSIWASGDIISQGIKKTYYAFTGVIDGWTTRSIAISNDASDATKALFNGPTAQAADNSKVDLSQDGSYLATYGVDSTRGEIQLSGTGTLVNGEARVYFDSSFSSITSDTAPIKVIITPTSVMQGQLYVDTKNQFGFVAKELNSQDNGTFDYLVIARRKGFDTDITPSPTPTPDATPTPTDSPAPSDTPTPTPTDTPSVSPTPSPTPDATVSPTPTPDATVTPTPSATPTPDVSPTPSPTPDPTPAPTDTPTP